MTLFDKALDAFVKIRQAESPQTASEAASVSKTPVEAPSTVSTGTAVAIGLGVVAVAVVLGLVRFGRR